MVFSKAAWPLAAFALMLAGAAQASEPMAISAFTLKNGMQVVLIENHRVPVVTHMMWYKVGGADDYDGRSGLAHYNEHMMFQGTEKVKGGEFSHIIANHGGHENAFTGRDYTAYYVSIAKDQLPLVMGLEADRMLHLAPTAENFAKEREVIIEERRMTIENQPEALLSEEMQAALYRNHPYHAPLIGWMHEMQALSREDVLAFHRQFYHPANAILVVAGDITRKDLQAMAEKYYGSLPAGDAYVRHWRSEPPQRGPRHIEMHHPNVSQPELVRYYVMPGVNTQDKQQAIPLYVMAQILGGGTTSRMYQSLVVEQKLATNVMVDYSGLNVGPGQMEIGAVPANNVSLATLEAAIDKELGKARTEPVSADVLARAKTLLKSDIIYARDGTENMARMLGSVVAVGLPVDYFNQWPSLIDAVSASDLQKAMGAVDARASVTGYLLPEPGRSTIAHPPAGFAPAGKDIR